MHLMQGTSIKNIGELISEIESLKEVISDSQKNISEKESEIRAKNSEIKIKDTEIQFLKEQLKLIKHNQYAKKSESAASLQTEIPFEPEELPEQSDADTDSGSEKETITYERKKTKRGRNIDASKLPTERVMHDLDESEKQCACCNSDLVCIGEDVATKIEHIPPSIKAIEHVRPKYTCRQCETVVAAKKPDEVMPKSMAGSSLLTEVILAKYQSHLPIYRQSKIFKQLNIDIPASTLGNWVLQVGEAAEPLQEAMYQQLNQAYALQVDETPVKNAKEDKKSYMWCYHCLDPGNRFIVFEYNLSRSAKVPQNRLSDFAGILQTDGYAGYNGLRMKNDIEAVGCFAHARRKFADVVKIADAKKPGKAHEAIAHMQKLYNIEEKARSNNLSHNERYELRQNEAVPLLIKFKQWLDKSIRHVPPKSAIGKAIDYALKQWPYLAAYADHGEIEIDNNLVENQIRPFALGRRNWLFVGNDRGAKAAATLYSLIQTCVLNDVNPRDYFNAILPRLPAVRRGEIEALSLLPQFFKKSDQSE